MSTGGTSAAPETWVDTLSATTVKLDGRSRRKDFSGALRSYVRARRQR